MSPHYVLPDDGDNTPFAEVDGKTLTRGDLENPVELTEDQAKRLEDAGITLEEVEPGETPELTGVALDNAVREADIEGASGMTADEKRAALADQSGTDEESEE